MKNYFIGFVALFIFSIVCYQFYTVVSFDNIKYVKIAGQNIKVEIASTDDTRAQGLSGKEKLEENEGLLFIFEFSAQHSFWMKDMNFAIDIIWINEGQKIVYIKKDARSDSYPETFTPAEDAKYVLEVVSGFSDRYNLKEGDVAQFTY